MLSTTLRVGIVPAAAPALREIAGDRAAGRVQQAGVAGSGQLAGELQPAVVVGLGKSGSEAQPGVVGSGKPGDEARPGAVGSGKPADDQQPGAAGAGKSEEEQPSAAGPSGEKRDPKELEVIRQLAARDAEVRAHEAAHAAAGGAYAGSPSFGYQRGPDGKNYAVSGEVPIDISAIAGDPEATIAKMQQVKRAALAPASPSGADRSIAANADATIAAARADLAINGGKDASKTESAENTPDQKSAADNVQPAPSSASGEPNAAAAQQADAHSPGEVARDLFGVFAHRSAGASAYQTSAQRDAGGVLSLTS